MANEIEPRSRRSFRRRASSTCSTAAPRPIPKPSLANGVPTIYTSQAPTELIVFKGQPDFVPVVGTQLLWASNTTSDVLIDTATTTTTCCSPAAGSRRAARPVRGPSSPATRCPPDFAKIPAQSLAGAVLADRGRHAAGAGSGDRELDSADRDGAAQERAEVHAELRRSAAVFAPIPGTPLSYVANSSEPVIQVAPNAYLRGRRRRMVHRPAVDRSLERRDVGARGDLLDPAVLADLLRDLRAASTKPRRSTCTSATRRAISAPSCRRTAPSSTAPAMRTRRGSAPSGTRRRTPTASPRRPSTTRGSGTRSASRWVSPPPRGQSRTGAGAYYHPGYWGGYPCCASASANVYGHWGTTTYSGTRTWYAGGGVAGTTASGELLQLAHRNLRHVQRGPPVQRVDGQRNARLRSHVQRRGRRLGQRRARQQLQHLHRAALDRQAASGTGAGGSTYNRAGATTAGPEGNAHVGGGSTYNAKTGNTNTWGTASLGNNHYADVNGNVYKNTGDGWQQHSSGAAGPARPATTRGPTASRRRAAPATTDGATSPAAGGAAIVPAAVAGLWRR